MPGILNNHHGHVTAWFAFRGPHYLSREPPWSVGILPTFQACVFAAAPPAIHPDLRAVPEETLLSHASCLCPIPSSAMNTIPPLGLPGLLAPTYFSRSAQESESPPLLFGHEKE